ncbi:hypothetical protein LEP1GSC034_1018 [Leptospira interrogans str. 2003000735]|uniref:Uncharacterized protein n=2 Tax=Leptospira interrogans TaxID=173 RepID=A0A829DBT4_LEPIR|nr:hypothetical protein [Leptospira interrogans]EMY06289.1 hypothetical protein LEP1GSC029_3155 [Leptospira interrogans str. 2002000626]EMY25652.1 hypothetical protein LEP1GSC115_1476 [Leptospira interrogans serovar Australis str. 200703203]EKN89880.1 hypothetical protein LEP1GSC027_3969 [Leptospira interrogans str. 2002000624]EKQ40260.1 hypothetical protein LEP1GSC025_2164 [Leptospira interrogans str. 2002000621]EKQ46045.1 hypothetical protein LEP1GSC026_3162 [Leptospira interrogans str. 2002
MISHLSYPVAPWNPQRGDQVTPKFGLHDYQQCMGNVFQDMIVFVGMRENISGFTSLTTYNYYALLESWISKHKRNIYDSADHAEHFNELMKANNLPYRIRKKKGNKEELCQYFENHSYPCGLGTFLTRKGHIIRGIGIVETSDGKKYLKASDPYGVGPRYIDPYGHLINYDLDELFTMGVPSIFYLEL